MANAEFLKHSSIPAKDYTGAHVSITQGGKTYLGTIEYICPDEALCIVRHFNGEQWPFNPALSRLNILDLSYCAICGDEAATEDDICGGCRIGQLVHMAETSRE